MRLLSHVLPDSPREGETVSATWHRVGLCARDIAEGRLGIRVVLHIASRSHYIVGLRFDSGGRGSVYDCAEEDELRALPTIDGTTRSAFGPDGIISGTERSERLLFWPTGVADTGAMRQWGRHATAFLGRRHFDDPDLIECRFLLLASP